MHVSCKYICVFWYGLCTSIYICSCHTILTSYYTYILYLYTLCTHIYRNSYVPHMMQYLLAKMALASDRYIALLNNTKPTPVYTIPSIAPESCSSDSNSSGSVYIDATHTHDSPCPTHTFLPCIHSNSESNIISVRGTLTSRQHLELCWGLLLRHFGMCDATDASVPSVYSGTTNSDINTTGDVVVDRLGQLNKIYDRIISNTGIHNSMHTTNCTNGSAPVYDKSGEYMYDLYTLKYIHDEYINTISNSSSMYNIVYGMIAISYRERPPMTAEEGEAVRSFFGFRARDIIMKDIKNNSIK